MRDYIYVEDVARANMLALEYAQKKKDSRSPDENAFNVGSGQATSVNALYDELALQLSSKAKAIHADKRPGELMESRLDVTRAKNELDFAASVSLSEGVKRTISWHKGSGLAIKH